MRILSDLIKTLQSTFGINKATLDASGLTAARTFTLPDQSGTLAIGGGALTPIEEIAKYAYGWEDFYQGNYPNGWFPGLYENNSTGFITTQATDQDAAGVAVFTTSTSAGGRAALISYVTTCFRLGGGESIFETRVRLGNLSDGTQTFTVRFGFMSDAGGDAPNGVFFRYTHSTNSGYWQGVARNNNSETATNFSTGPVTTGWQKMKIVVNAAGTSAEFFINGTSVGTVTSNIPTASGRETSIGASIIKSAGTTARTLLMDYLAWQIALNR